MCDTCLLVPVAAGSEAFGGANGSSVQEMVRQLEDKDVNQGKGVQGLVFMGCGAL